jgi:hypothetical protein
MVLEEQQAALVKSKESKNEEKPGDREAEETIASTESFREGHLFVLTGTSERFYHVFGLELCGKPPSPNYYCTCARIRLYLYVHTYPLLFVRVRVFSFICTCARTFLMTVRSHVYMQLLHQPVPGLHLSSPFKI